MNTQTRTSSPMSLMTRRHFLGTGALGLAAFSTMVPGLGECQANPLGLPIGFQVYPVRDLLAKDFAGTLRQMAALGYQAVEMCSPPGYVSSGFEPLVKMKAGEMRRIIEDAGLRCESCHYSFQELKESLDERMSFAQELGLKQMIASGFWLKAEAKMADWIQACKELNQFGERTRKAGLQLGFHNHHFEFKEIDGVLIYDELMRHLDPNLIKMQFQVAVISIGYQAVTYFKKYPGRFISLHLADWSATEKKSVPIGQGVVDWKNLFASAREAGVKNYFVEMNLPTLKPSCEFLRELKVA
jgi:sugar phosphate isomerase/epimerase